MSGPAKQSTAMHAYTAWDRTTRWFHWINVICVLTLGALGAFILNAGTFGVSADGKILLKTLHVYVGYVFAINLLWRLIWAFVGSSSARWKRLLPFRRGYVAELRNQIRGVRTGEGSQYLGHNPIGRLMVTLLLLLLLTQAVTGIVLAGTDLYKPPFGGTIAEWVTAGDADKLGSLTPGSKEFVDEAAYDEMRRFRKPVVTTHEYAFFLLLIAVVLHVGGVVIAEVREGGGLISAMITGRKVLSEVPCDQTDQSSSTDSGNSRS